MIKVHVNGKPVLLAREIVLKVWINETGLTELQIDKANMFDKFIRVDESFEELTTLLGV